MLQHTHIYILYSRTIIIVIIIFITIMYIYNII
jgi:hypothetical protein